MKKEYETAHGHKYVSFLENFMAHVEPCGGTVVAEDRANHLRGLPAQKERIQDLTLKITWVHP